MTGPLITTSWDDGHPLDLRLVEMLTRHGLAGTFYIPRRDIRPVMTDAQIRSISDAGFEVGAHTMDHIVLTGIHNDEAQQQITESRAWVSNVTGKPCPMFCPPCGKHNAQHIEMIRDAGYLGYRTVELWTVDRPRRKTSPNSRLLLEMPTSVQAQPHSLAQAARNLIKRRTGHNAYHFLRYGLIGDWTRHTASLIEHTLAHRGVFHLWGHSWEIEAHQQWDKLEAVFALMATYLDRAEAATNAQVCQAYHPVARAARAYRKSSPELA